MILPKAPLDWLQIGKGVRQAYILSPFLFDLYVEYIMSKASLDEAQARIKIARTNIITSDMQKTSLLQVSKTICNYSYIFPTFHEVPLEDSSSKRGIRFIYLFTLTMQRH